jgi:hypothetical protein
MLIRLSKPLCADLIAFAVQCSRRRKGAEDKVVQPREIADPSIGGDAGDLSEARKRRAKRRLTATALAVRHVRQTLHGGALVVRRKMRVLARNRGALVSYDFARDKV